MNHERPDRIVQDWTSTGFTALPTGWRNVYRDDDGSVHTEPCPGVLVEELRITRRCWDIPRPGGQFNLRTEEIKHDPPYATRAVFACMNGSELWAVSDVDNYLGTLDPDEDPSRYEEHQQQEDGA